MNRKLLAILILTFISYNTFAQKEGIDTLSQDPKRNILPYISLTSLVENYSSFDVGASKPTQNGNAIGMELGYIYDIDALNSSISESWYQNVYGAKAYFYYRLILDSEEPYPFNSKVFIDFEPQIFWVSYESERIAGYSCNEQWGDCEYYRFFDSRVSRIIPGLNFKFGQIYEYDYFQFTLFMGLGIRHIVEFSDLMNDPAPDKLFTKSGEISSLGTGTALNLRIGLQVAYKFWK